MALFIGLMSGTSLDALDVAIVDINDGQQIKLLQAENFPLETPLKSKLLRLINSQYDDDDAIELLGECDALLGEAFAAAVNQLIDSSPYSKEQISAIGSHGQTIRHRPASNPAFTMQIGDASRIAEQTGITTIADFRSRDIAAGGQGAPLVPAFHRAAFSHPNENRCVINIGGMANISYLPADSSRPTCGFDTGPGNVLLDYWCELNTQQAFDKNGDWGRSGKLDHQLLSAMLTEPYFSQPLPKSTGRELFNASWLQNQINHLSANPEDIQASLTELTARSITDAIDHYFPATDKLILCGGGSRNQFLRERVQHHCGSRIVEDTSDYNIEPDWVEAVAFAWLGYCTLNNIPANEPAATGAHSRVILGAIYPA